MLSREENELMTQVGRGTPCGELLRRYWQPAALNEELPADGPPIPIRLLGEDLVLFRDDKGRVGLLGLLCSHRGADLSYGRLEDGGIRCIYHGWLYDIHGRCLEQPAEPPESKFAEKIRHLAYPCVERAGLIFAYLGPGEPPLLPNYEFLTVPRDHIIASKVYSEANYLQALEGGIDPVHVTFLHRDLSRASDPRTFGNTPPAIHTEETDFGVRIFMIRKIDADQNYVGITNYVLPNVNTFMGPFGRSGYGANWFVPIDDTHSWKYNLNFDREKPIPQDDRRRRRGDTDADYHPVASKSNRYLQDRASMKAKRYSGIPVEHFQAQDACVAEAPGPILDRSHEHLGYTDQAIIASRNLLQRAIEAIRAGKEPPHVIREPSANRFDHLVVRSEVLPQSVDWRTFWR